MAAAGKSKMWGGNAQHTTIVLPVVSLLIVMECFPSSRRYNSFSRLMEQPRRSCRHQVAPELSDFT
jgi:hypothetical protein